MSPLPDDAVVVRGGMCLPENFAQGSGVALDQPGKLVGVSVNSAAGKAVADLTAPNSTTGYPGVLNNQIGVSTVGQIRAAGGDVVASPSSTNPYHATLNGLTPERASELFRPTIANPSRRRKGG